MCVFLKKNQSCTECAVVVLTLSKYTAHYLGPLRNSVFSTPEAFQNPQTHKTEDSIASRSFSPFNCHTSFSVFELSLVIPKSPFEAYYFSGYLIGSHLSSIAQQNAKWRREISFRQVDFERNTQCTTTRLFSKGFLDVFCWQLRGRTKDAGFFF